MLSGRTITVNFLTTEEAATRLGISVATVRKRAARGDLPAKKAGGQWLIVAEGIAELERSQKVSTGKPDSLDLSLALKHVKATDLKELWVPDVLRFEDYLAHTEEVLRRSEEHLRLGVFDAAVEVDLAKTHFFTRSGLLLSLEDRIAYQAAIAAIAPAIEANLSKVVYSARLSDDPKWFLKKGSKAWVDWKKLVKQRLKDGNDWMIKTDITAYFDSILHRLLMEQMDLLEVDRAHSRLIEQMLSTWAAVQGMGLPQGPNASRVLGNFYLAPVDQVILEEGEGKFEYFRYQDDVRIVGKKKNDVIAGLRRFERECRRRGLTASAGKTRLLGGAEAIRDCENAARESAQYRFDAGDLPRARRELSGILKDALRTEGVIDEGNVRFSLWRLARIRERSVLRLTLNRLEDLAPVPSVVAAYLSHFVYRRHVADSISSFLADNTRAHSTSLVTWLFAAMLEKVGEVPISWVRQARYYTQDRNNPVYLRAISVCVLARGKYSADLDWIKQEIRNEFNPDLLRAYTVALTWGRSLGAQEKQSLAGKSPIVARTVKYMDGRQQVPSLISYSRNLVIE